MTYAAIMVHAEPAERAEPRLRLAACLANLFDAMLIGVGAETHLSSRETVAHFGADLGRQLQEEAVRTDLMAAQRRFEPIASHVVAGHQWRCEIGQPDEVIIGQSRAADLIVLAPAAAERDAHRQVDPGEVLMRAGRPILVASAALETLDPCRVVVGWKDGPACRRATSDALPFLKQAVQVRVVEVCEDGPGAEAEARVKDVAVSLGRHGVTASGEVVAGRDADATTRLLDLCADWEADLLVVGGYGRSRAREWIFGGVTRELLKGGPTPVLLSH